VLAGEAHESAKRRGVLAAKRAQEHRARPQVQRLGLEHRQRDRRREIEHVNAAAGVRQAPDLVG